MNQDPKQAHQVSHQSATEFDVIVIGGGHAGIEAALAPSRMGCKVAFVTMTIDSIGLMPCNPSIGGPAKGQIVGEIDALGGEMGRAADETAIQVKILNRSRGPAVQCLRSQNDKHAYNDYMKNKILNDPNITVIQQMAEALLFEQDKQTGQEKAVGIITQDGQHILAKSIVITTGTFLNAKMHTGLTAKPGGRLGELSAEHLSDSLKKRLRLGRLKTGTPPRLDRNSIDYSQLPLAPGDPECLRFSFRTPINDRYLTQLDCHITHTTPKAHAIILANLDRSPLFTKVIEGIGPRYCPSIEDKVMRFQDKETHQIFLEPEGRFTDEVYPQGLNTSLPEDVQEAVLREMPGLKNVVITKMGYAVEYDFVFPDQLKPTLEVRQISNLFLAGQINGTSGYEEAAGQGIIAGINAGLRAKNRGEFILKREESFIGTMIDDLITKSIKEPYRMLTSRSEYRLLLRQDNATRRLSHYARDMGLITADEFEKIQSETQLIHNFVTKWTKTSISDALIQKYALPQRVKYHTIMKRPDFDIQDLLTENLITPEEKEAAQKSIVNIKYEGYIERQEQDIDKITKMESKPIPKALNYDQILGLRNESREKLKQHRPKTIYEAKRISGINPADIMILISVLSSRKKPTLEETPQ